MSVREQTDFAAKAKDAWSADGGAPEWVIALAEAATTLGHRRQSSASSRTSRPSQDVTAAPPVAALMLPSLLLTPLAAIARRAVRRCGVSPPGAPPLVLAP